MDESIKPYLLAVDPGEGTGYVVLSRTGIPLTTGITRSREELYAVLKDIPEEIELVVMEDYRLFQKKAIQQSGSKLETVRVIGAIDSWAALREIPVHLQPASILPIAKRWTGIVPKGAHKNGHHVSALLHGMYYLYKNNILQMKRRAD